MALCTTPALAALSKAEVIARRASEASFFLPEVTRIRYFLSRECSRDLMRRLCACLRALLRMRRSADLVFGIKYFLDSERATVAKQAPLSTTDARRSRP